MPASIRLFLLVLCVSAFVLTATARRRKSKALSKEEESEAITEVLKLEKAAVKEDDTASEELLKQKSLSSEDHHEVDEPQGPPSIIPRRTFLHTISVEDLGKKAAPLLRQPSMSVEKEIDDQSMSKSKESDEDDLPPSMMPMLKRQERQHGGADFRHDFGPATTADEDFWFVMYPAGYITDNLPSLWSGGPGDSDSVLKEAEKETPVLGYYDFTKTAPVEVSFDDKLPGALVVPDPENEGEMMPFQPNSEDSYLIQHPQCAEEASADVIKARMIALYKGECVALQLGKVGCTLAAFDMSHHHVTGSWTYEESVGGIAVYGGRTEEEQMNDFGRAGLVAIEAELSWEDPAATQALIAEYGPAIGSLKAHGHAMILDEIFIVDKVPQAIFVRDPMNGLAFAIPWAKASRYFSKKLHFATKKGK